MIRVFLLMLTVLAAAPAAAEEVVAGLSQNRVSITANFDGSEILIFGAVKRETPTPDDGSLEVIVTVEGPQEPVTVRRKAKRYGIWVNVDGIEVDLAPSFYAISSTNPLDQILKDVEDLRYNISIPRAIRAVGVAQDVEDPENFVNALIRIREDNGLYQVRPNTVSLNQDTLFNTSVALPSNLREGGYLVRFFLTRNGNVLDEYVTTIDVQKVGLERFLYNLAHDRPLIYGLLSLAIAIAAGWGASAVFRYLRG